MGIFVSTKHNYGHMNTANHKQARGNAFIEKGKLPGLQTKSLLEETGSLMYSDFSLAELQQSLIGWDVARRKKNLSSSFRWW